jgi:hypothetical protein
MDTLLFVMAVFGPGAIDAQPSNTIETRSKPILTKQISLLILSPPFLKFEFDVLYKEP